MFFDKSKVEYQISVEQDLTPVRGNALASGNAAVDKEEEDAIIERLDQGEVWAWAAVTVTATYGGFAASDHLGCCTYADEADFMKSDYYSDMKAEALKALEKLVKDNTPGACGMGEDDHLGCEECQPTWKLNQMRRTQLKNFLKFMHSVAADDVPDDLWVNPDLADALLDRYQEWLKAGEPE